MTEISRRGFLQLAGGSAAMAALTASIDRAAALPAFRRAGDINDVEHIVVLMQENRSFDHYFGRLRGIRGFGDPRPVTLPSGKSVFHQPASKRKVVLPFHPTADDLGMQFLTGLNHDWAGGHAAWNGGKYDNWIPAKTANTMAYLERDDIPFHYALADAFTICDAYFCSFIGATDPNRYYMLTGYTGNDGAGGGPVLGNEEAGYGWTTYAERLQQAGISWRVYQDIGDGLDAAGHWGWINDAYRGNYGDNSLLYFNTYRNSAPGNPLYDRARTGTNVKAGDGLFDQLTADVQGGRLPQVSWIAAPEAFSEHSNWPTNYGAWYIAGVLDALTSDPEVWSKTAVFITYDENDGFFDHIVPPYPPATAAQGLSTVPVVGEHHDGSGGYAAGHYGPGPRVPMFVVSPWSTGGYSCSEVFDHTSILQFMERRFGVTEPNISPWRRAICGDLTSAFDFGTVATSPPPLPDTSGYEPPDRDRHPSYVPKPPASPAMPKQEQGSRPTRPLRYAPLVDGSSSPSTGRFALTFGSGPAAGASFYVTAGNRSDVPWTYTVEAGKQLTDSWNSTYYNGVYDLTVHGPNGFLSTFRGPGATATAEVTARHDGTTGDLVLTLTNPTATVRHITLTNAYGGQSSTVIVQPGATVSHRVGLQGTGHWYDVTARSTEDTGFLRRFAGYVETGQPGYSDPAIAQAP